MLKFIENKTNFDGLFTVTKTVITDSRGYFERLFSPKELKCWGRNILGQLGIGNNTNLNAPSAAINLGGKAIAISLGKKHFMPNTGKISKYLCFAL